MIAHKTFSFFLGTCLLLHSFTGSRLQVLSLQKAFSIPCLMQKRRSLFLAMITDPRVDWFWAPKIFLQHWNLFLDKPLPLIHINIFHLYRGKEVYDLSTLKIYISCTYVVRSHRRRVESQEPERANCPSEEMTTSLTKWEWPIKERWGIP